ncbi:hypothetical protein PVAP13_5KG577907 [Panicum virgatum]|uniref:Uncharacterized protein n=1 Tax=Panicum virgatum TaxID=38727 RepID=A0A8T0ST24_PANVG|nr:hypothetical protein PVAP13_5KG577907 [Panicum virgatum]
MGTSFTVATRSVESSYIYMCVAYFQGYIFAVHLLLVDLYMLLLAPLAKYKQAPGGGDIR